MNQQIGFKPDTTAADFGKNVSQSVIALAASDATPAFPKIKLNRGGWVDYGPKNDFPQQIVALNNRSPVNKAIIDSTVTYICGKGVRDTPENADLYVGMPNTSEAWDDLIEPIAKDYKTFAGFYWQVVVNKGSTTVSIFHQDFTTVRLGQTTATGTPLTFRISNDWTKTSGKNKPLELEVWPGMKDAKKGKAYMFYWWDYEPGLMFYSIPGYYAAMEYIKADGELGRFYNNSIENGFTPSVVISMPSNPEQEKKDVFQKEMENAFGGAKGASSIVTLWGENDNVKPTITPFNASANADIYNNVEGIVFQKIISANRLCSPTLAGVSGSGNLSGNAAEIIDAYVLYNYTVVEKMRRKILDKLNIFTKINGTAELRIDDLDVLPKINSMNNPDQITASTETEGGGGSLAAEIGVGGTQAMTAIIESPNIPDEQKRGLLKTLFGLDDATIESLFAPKKATLQKKKPRLIRFFEEFLKTKKFPATWK